MGKFFYTCCWLAVLNDICEKKNKALLSKKIRERKKYKKWPIYTMIHQRL